jgi:hypothetical protein
MNLRRDKIDETKPLPEYKFRVNDRVKANGGITGKILVTGTLEKKNYYIIETEKSYCLGTKSVDHDIKLLKPVGVEVRSMTLWEDEVTLETIDTIRKFPHIIIGSQYVQTVPINHSGSYGTSSTGPH